MKFQEKWHFFDIPGALQDKFKDLVYQSIIDQYEME